MAERLSRADVLALLQRRLSAVLARPAEAIAPDARFDEDLQADSLDLVEAIEGVEAELAARGLRVSLTEDDLLAVRTVADVATRLHRRAIEGGA